MKASEYYSQFRYGNWIFCGDEYQRFKYFDGKNVYTTNGWHLPDEEVEEPIPLTPEILEKCGFRKVFRWYSYRVGDKEVLSFEWDGSENFLTITMLGDRSPKIYHLHHLQNIISNLTQTELNVEI